MDKVQERLQDRQIAVIDRDIRRLEKVPTRYDKMNLGARATIIALGGKTYTATLIALIAIPVMTMFLYYLIRFESYVLAVLATGMETIVLLQWTYRRQGLASAKLSKDGLNIVFDDDDPDVVKLTPEGEPTDSKQIAGRRGMLTSNFDESLEAVESEAGYRTDLE